LVKNGHEWDLRRSCENNLTAIGEKNRIAMHIRACLPTRVHPYTCIYRPHVLRNDVARTRWWRCRMSRGSCLRWGSKHESPVLATRGATCVGYPAPSTSVPRPRDPFKCPTARRPDPQELLELLFYRGNPRAEELPVYSIIQPPIHHQTFQQRPLPQFAISVTSVINNDT